MNIKQPIPCPECDREKYFEGLCYACNSRKERERYEQLSQAEIDLMMANIVQHIETVEDSEEAYDQFRALLAYQDINTSEIAKAALEKTIFYPPTLYRDASEAVQDKLIALLRDPNCKEADHLLSCLAVIGRDKVRAAFYELEKNPLPWRKKLYVDPSFYAGLGGWTFDEQGENITLNYTTCYSLLKENREDPAVTVAAPLSEKCSVCQCPTVNILSLDGNEERLSFLGLKGKVNLPLCPNCAMMCEKTVIRYQVDGNSSFEIIQPLETRNFITDKDYQKLTHNQLTLSAKPKPVYFSCGCDEVSTIGGYPEWIQDWQYEDCPDCKKKMKLLAALSWDQLLGGAEGILYVEICTDCSVAVTVHQQT